MSQSSETELAKVFCRSIKDNVTIWNISLVRDLNRKYVSNNLTLSHAAN